METHELLFQSGLVVNQEFFTFEVMQESAKNWSYLLKYRLGTGSFYGHHYGMILNQLQFSHAEYHEGMLLTGVSPKDCITIGVLQKSAGTVMINSLKMKPGDVIVIDDSKPFDLVSSHATVLLEVSIHKELIKKEIPWMLNAADKKFKDKDNIFSETLENELRGVLDDPNLSDNSNRLEAIEEKIVNAIIGAFAGQTGESSHLTKGEQTALEVKSFLHDSIDEKITVQTIIKQFEISDKTLETSFKSLFGMTPKHFISLLKLNKAHEDLKTTNAQTTNVSDIAIKWGFSHFGRFAKYYKALFGELPSETLMLTPTASS